MKSLEQKTVVVTGATRGFGLQVARAFVNAGANLVITSRSAGQVDETVNMLQSEGYQVSGLATDVSQLADVEKLADHAVQVFGKFDVWVNNAAISGPYGPSIEIPIEYFASVLQTNIFGAYYGSLVAMRHFLPQQRGKLINISGRGDRGPQPMQNAYASSKAWLKNFTLALAKEYRNSKVGVYLLNPGMMATDMTQNIRVISGFENRLTNFGSVLRLLAVPPDESARKAVWLASSATDGRTGLFVRQMNTWNMLGKLLGSLYHRVTGRYSEPPVEITLTSIPPEIEL
jgi:glucose 1-dehydrogenase